nr:putative selenium-dependent hydroxylase accessory protein YqeC [Anaerolineae bacterium]
MRLAQAFTITPGDVVSFVGAGGKTSTMFRLADELVDSGLSVITTTTTRIAQDELPLSHICREDYPTGVGKQPHTFILEHLLPDGKVKGVAPDWIDRVLVPGRRADLILIEADGSRRLPLKIPFPHEPVIPVSTTKAVIAVGLSALNKPFDANHVYGAENAYRLPDFCPESHTTPDLIADLLIHPDGGLKNIPDHADVMVFLNQVMQKTFPGAGTIARKVLSETRISRVVIGAAQEAEPVRAVHRRIGAVILAAGTSSRMGTPKLLLPWQGSTMIRKVCSRVVSEAFYEVIVVTGSEHDAISQEVADLPVKVVFNPNYAEGEMIGSLKVGLDACTGSDTVMVVLGDMPAIQKTVISDLLDIFASQQKPVVVPVYRGKRGHPVIFDKSVWGELRQLPPGSAPRAVLAAHPEMIHQHQVSTDTILHDIDTPNDYQSANSHSDV